MKCGIITTRSSDFAVKVHFILCASKTIISFFLVEIMKGKFDTNAAGIKLLCCVLRRTPLFVRFSIVFFRIPLPAINIHVCALCTYTMYCKAIIINNNDIRISVEELFMTAGMKMQKWLKTLTIQISRDIFYFYWWKKCKRIVLGRILFYFILIACGKLWLRLNVRSSLREWGVFLGW